MFQKRSNKESRKHILALICTLSFALLAGLLGVSPEMARAEVPLNYGNPFENGDFVQKGAQYTGGYTVAGVQYSATGSWILPKTGEPFEYPADLTAAGQNGHPTYGQWGGGDFFFLNFELSENTRNIKLS